MQWSQSTVSISFIFYPLSLSLLTVVHFIDMEQTEPLCAGISEEKAVCEKKNWERIGQLLAELLESERSYVQDLNQVISSSLIIDIKTLSM